MLVREIVGKFVSGLFLGIGYFWAIFDKEGQAWHDKIAGTVVTRQSSVHAPQPVVIAAAAPTGAARFCSACGATIQGASQFCASCGSRP
jgi:predicted anti-sigma-YlaC factor YlaD